MNPFKIGRFSATALAVLSFVSAFAWADPVLRAGTSAADQSDTITGGLASRGFSCGAVTDAGRLAAGHADRKGQLTVGAFDSSHGLECIGTIAGYPKPVAIVVPASYRVTHNVELLFYFHGFNTPPVYGMPEYLLNYGLIGSLNASARNVVMVAPLGVGAPPPEFAQLTDTAHPERFRDFIDTVASIIQSAGLAESSDFGTISLMSHSGGYAPIANVLKSGTYADRIRSVYLLDSLYSQVDTYVAYARDPSHRFWSAYGPIFQPGYTGLPDRAMMASLHTAGAEYVHFPVGTAPLRENRMHALTADEARANRVGFIQTDGEHVKTVRNFMSVFLAGGSADDEQL